MALVHLGAIGLIGITPLAWPLRLALWGALAWSLYHSLITHARRTGPNAVLALERDGEGMLRARLGGRADWQTARVTSRFIHPWITLMALRIESRRWPVNVVIAADAVDPEPFRRWRVALQSQAPEA